MKLFTSLPLALCGAAMILTYTAFAGKPTPPPPPPPPSSGTVVLDYSGPEATGAAIFGLTVAPSGAVYASGTVVYDNPEQWNGIVLGSTDDGATWSGPLDDFGAPGFYVYGGVMASDAAGNLYVASQLGDSEISSSHYIVRRSIDGGLNWTTVDDCDQGGPPITGLNEPTAITVDAAGDVYYAGRTFIGGVGYWTVRKGVGGTSFSRVDLASGEATGIYAHPTAGLFAVGSRSACWVVRRSTDGGATWSEINAFQLQSGQSSRALGIAADSSGNLYVVGRATTKKGSTTTTHWLVRKSTDRGATFSTIDDFVPSGSSWLGFGSQVVATPNGDLYVVWGASISGVGHWLLRKSVGGTGPWTTVDDFQNATPRCIAADASGNVFVGGDNGRAIIKRY